MVTKAMGGCVSSQKREIIVPKTPVKDLSKLLVIIEMNKYIRLSK